MSSVERVKGHVIDAHSHIGELAAWKFYNLAEPVKPTVYDFAGYDDYIKSHLDLRGLERGLILPNYGIPVQEQPFSLNDLVLDAVGRDDRLQGGLWVSFLPANRDMTMRTLEKVGESRIVAIKTTFLLGGNPNPETWDAETREIAEACFNAAEEHDLVFHFHTSAGGSSDINNFIPLIEEFGKRVKIYIVHFGGGVRGPYQARSPVPGLGGAGIQGVCRHDLGDRLRCPLVVDRDREARRRPGPRAVRLG